MQSIKTAIIVAAGIGKRFHKIRKDIPKGLLKIGKREIIKESIDKLVYAGIEDIILVTGFRKHKYFQALNKDFPFIRYIENNQYKTTGSMHSLFLTANAVDSDFFLLESDLIYEYRCIESIIGDLRENTLLLSGETKSGDEVYVYGSEEKVIKITKKHLSSKPMAGELIGISKISQPFFRNLCQYYERNYNSLSKSHYEECISDLTGKFVVNYLKIEDAIWTEIDDPNQYNRAINEIYPKIYGDYSIKG